MRCPGNSAFSWLVTVFGPSSGTAARVPPVVLVQASMGGHVLQVVLVRAWMDVHALLVVRVQAWMVFPHDLPSVRICRADTLSEARIRCRTNSLSWEQSCPLRTCRRQHLSVGQEGISCRRGVSVHSDRS